jgi:hypothetical protein
MTQSSTLNFFFSVAVEMQSMSPLIASRMREESVRALRANVLQYTPQLLQKKRHYAAKPVLLPDAKAGKREIRGIW